MYFQNDGVIDNCTFENNGVQANGGVIQCCQNEATLIVKNSKFVNNHAAHGGAIYAMNANSFLIVDNCTFENNRASGYETSRGGAISAHRGNITHSKFINNYAPGKGGAIYFKMSAYYIIPHLKIIM